MTNVRKKHIRSVGNRERVPRLSFARRCLQCVLALAVIGSAANALGTDYRIVVEKHSQQSPQQLQEAAVRLLGNEVRVTPLFDDVDPADDPFLLGNIYAIDNVTVGQSESPWDVAYRLQSAADLVRAEPDMRDVLLGPTSRTLLCPSELDETGTENPNWALLAMNVDAAWKLPPPAGGKRFGEGVRVCSLDTGWSDHVDLDQSSLDFESAYDFLDLDNDARDPLNYHGHRGHGTSTASVIASTGGMDEDGNILPPGKITGVAPAATVVPIRSLRSVVHFLDSNIAKAVRRSVKAQCDVVSMSLGGRVFFGLRRALADAVRNEVIPVAAAGNCVGFVVSPAVFDSTVSVAASNVRNKPWKGSSRGRAVDITAPGERIHVAWRRSVDGDPTDVRQSDGTSYATAHTAGAAALWLAYHGEDAIRAAYGNGTRKDLFLRLIRQSANVPDGWDTERYGAGILDVAGLLQRPLRSAQDPAYLRTAPGSDLELLSRTTGYDVSHLRSLLEELWTPLGFDAAIKRYGPELLHIAVSEPEGLQSMLASLDAGNFGARRQASMAVDRHASRTLVQSFGGFQSGPDNQAQSAQSSPATQRVLMEVDRMQGTQPIVTEQTIRGQQVSLVDIYAAAGIELRIVEDQTDIPRTRSVRLSDLHALMSTNRSLVPEEGEWHMYALVVTRDRSSRDTLGIMFDYGDNDANDMPRESFAVFEEPHENLSGGVTREMLLTTAHELAHAFNLHHTDWEGSSFMRRSTVEGYSLTDTVRWELSEASRQHLRSHPGRLVSPGTGNLPFGMISQDHAERHQSTPRENYAVVPENTSTVSRMSPTESSAAIRTSLGPANDVSDSSPVSLKIEAVKDTYSVGEAVSLTVAVVNESADEHEVVTLLSPEYGFLHILIRAPGAEEFRPYRPPVLRTARKQTLSKSLAPGEALVAEARVFFGSSGWTFEEPGEYEITAAFPADTEFSSDSIQSNTLRLTIEDAASDANANRLMFDRGGFGLGVEQGLYLYMDGGDHLDFAAGNLRELVREFPDANQADPARLALANEALQPTVDPASGDSSTPRVDEAKEYLRGLQQSSDVSGIGLLRVQQKMIQQLESEGRDEEARSFREDMDEQFEQSRDLQMIDPEFIEREFN